MTASPLKERSVRNVASATAGDVMPPRQAPQAQTALAPELTTLLDELDAALDDPIGS